MILYLNLGWTQSDWRLMASKLWPKILHGIVGKESESKSELALCLHAFEKVIPSIRSLILRMREFESCELWELFDSRDTESRDSYPGNASWFAPLVAWAEERPVTNGSQKPSALIDSIRTQKHQPCSTPFIPEALGWWWSCLQWGSYRRCTVHSWSPLGTACSDHTWNRGLQWATFGGIYL